MRRFILVGLSLSLMASTVRGTEDFEVSSQRQPALVELIDRTLEKSWSEAGIEPTEICDDATFLRRLCLDLCGTIPTREEVDEFLRDPRPDKREAKIQEYLHDRAFAENVAALWSSVLLDAAPQGPQRVYLRPWLEETIHHEVPFADIVRELVGGRGRNDENGATSFALSYSGEPESLAAVTARSFLGLQIQCAQCHDHPYDDWTQEDFAGFAGFFVTMRGSRVAPSGNGNLASFRLYDVDREEQRRDRLKTVASLIQRARGERGAEVVDETSSDPIASMSKAEFLSTLVRDGELDEERLGSLLAELPPEVQERIQQAREKEEQYRVARFLDGMDYADTPLLTPREALAEWIVDTENPYFARAVVNRTWGHLFGRGLIEPVDDLSGAEDALEPLLLETLAREFQGNTTDLRFLFGTLVRTRAYARSVAATSSDADERLRAEQVFAARPVRPLSSEQLLHSLLRATVTEEFVKRKQRGEAFEAVRERLLQKFRYAFSDDEAGEEDSFGAGIPQALFLMNGRLTNDAITLKKNATLQSILRESKDNRERIRQVFLATLNRPPTTRELQRLGKLIKGAGKHSHGVEDLYWALLNSSEFLTNH